jgi:hypothetical protein
VTYLRFEHGDLFDPLFNWLFHDLAFPFKVYVEPERVLIEIFASIIAPTTRVPDVLRFSSFILRDIPEHRNFGPRAGVRKPSAGGALGEGLYVTKD